MDRVAGDRPGRRILLCGDVASGGEGGVEDVALAGVAHVNGRYGTPASASPIFKGAK